MEATDHGLDPSISKGEGCGPRADLNVDALPEATFDKCFEQPGLAGVAIVNGLRDLPCH
jgi:hypothetical protein